MIADDNSVNISYATDSNYVVPTCVSMFSLAQNAYRKRIYEIYVLITEKVTADECEQLRLAVSNYGNIKVNIITVDTLYVKTTIPHISNITYYKCFLMRYLPIKVDKCVWLDSDTIVSGDIGEIYDFELHDDYLGGVPSYGTDNSWAFSEKILLREKTHYFNAGVLLMNLAEMRRASLDKAMDRLVPLQYPTQDQDVMNIACHGRKSVLPMKCNFQPVRFAQHGVSILEQFGKIELTDAIQAPIVIHFLTSEKPWHKVQYDYALLWRKYYFELTKNSPKSSEILRIDSEEQYRELSYRDIEAAETVLFYGAALRCVKTLGVCNAFDARKPDIIWDINSGNIRDIYGYAVSRPFENMANLNKAKSLVIICVDDPSMREDIYKNLILNGFSILYQATDYTLAMWKKKLIRRKHNA